jgi:aspartate beta-hydroxylase
MSTLPPLPVVSAELGNAREHVRLGRLAEAEQSFRQVLAQNPDSPEALRFLANAALARGNPAEAVELLNRAADSNREDRGILLELGAAYRAGERLDAARYVLERVLSLSGGSHPAARLLLANVLELDQRPELALLHYFRAILEAQRAGQWLDDNSTEPGLRLLVRHAMWYVARERRALFEQAMQQAHGEGGRTDRIERALAIYLRESDESPADPQQKPSFLYIPDLGTGRFLENSLFPDIDEWTRCLTALSDEIAACVDAPPASAHLFSLGALGDAGTADAQAPLPARSVAVYRRGLLDDAARKLAPGLTAAVDALPLVRIPQHGPDVEIIVLNAGARLPLSPGRTNSRVTVLIALEAGQGMDVEVGGESRVVQTGEAIVFDSSFGCEFGNSSGGPAHAICLEVWHPALSSAEREAIAALTGAVVDFDTRLQELP